MNWLKRFAFLMPVILFLLAMPWALTFFSQGVDDRVSSECLQVVRKSISRAAIECYALEGFYPPNLDYLTEHYGMVIDRKQYFVDYSYLGSNLMPDIAVLPAVREVSIDE